MSAPEMLIVEDAEALACGLVRVLDSRGYMVRRPQSVHGERVAAPGLTAPTRPNAPPIGPRA